MSGCLWVSGAGRGSLCCCTLCVEGAGIPVSICDLVELEKSFFWEVGSWSWKG